MTVPKKYRKLPVEITAIELTQYGDFVRAVAWINDNGGSAVFSPALREGDVDSLIVTTIEGNMEAGVGWFIIRGVKGEFYPCDGDIFRLSYEAVEEPVSVENLTGTGMYQGGRPDGRKSLVGGAAVALPHD